MRGIIPHQLGSERAQTDITKILHLKLTIDMNGLLQKFLAERQMEYLTVDGDFRIQETSGDVQRFADIPDEVGEGKDVRDCFPELFGLEDTLEAVMSGEQTSFDLKGIGRFSDPKYPLYFDIYAMENEPDKHLSGRLVIFFENVTEHRVNQQKYVQSLNQANLFLATLEATNSYIDKIITSMADALFVTTVSGQIQKVNQAALDLFGYSEQELIARSISTIITNEDILRQFSLCDHTPFNHIEVSCRKKTGEKILVSFSCAIFQTDIHDLQNLIYIGRDISERKRMEAELQQVNEDLTLSVNKLKQRNSEITLLSELSHTLQECRTLKDAYGVIAKQVQPLFPDLVGGVFTIEAAKHVLDAVAVWGNPLLKEKRSKLHLPPVQNGVGDNLSQMLGQYLHADSPPAEYYWVPMMTQEETIGLFYLSSLEPGKLTESRQQLAMTVAEHIGLALANLQLRETLRNQSIQDPLTGLYNRRYMEQTLEREIDRAARSQQPLGIIILDIDHFKRFNDTFGHQAGDAVLQAVGRGLKKNIGSADMACRYGGEELVVMTRGTNLDVTTKHAEQLRLVVRSMRVEYEGQPLGCITISLGVACFPKHGQTLQELIQAADAALYRAKASGRDRVIAASQPTAVQAVP